MNILNLKEKPNKFATIYYGIVKIVDDPTKQGRIKVELPEVFGETEPDQTPWIYPIGYNSGVRLFNVPDLDTEVGIVFLGDFYTGFYGINKYSKTQSKLFDDDYPNVYGIEDAQGNYLTVNKKTGDIIFHHLSGTEFKIDKDGNTSAKITGTLTAEVSKAVKMTAPTTEMNTNLTVNGTCTITDTCTFEGIKWITHVHPYYWTHDGGSDNTNYPQNG